jgi:hypothetical protein
LYAAGTARALVWRKLAGMTDSSPLSPLPEVPAAAQIRDLAPEGLDDIDRALRDEELQVRQAMAPYENRLADIRSRRQIIATERRRRERMQISARRKEVQRGAKSGSMPSLVDALATLDLSADIPLGEINAFLATGGAVGFGFATRPGTIAFTDGREQKQAKTWGDARQLFLDGWEPGSPAIPGVRIHLAGTRVERVVAAGDVVIEPPDVS